MNTKVTWTSFPHIESLLELETSLLLICSVLGGWIFYRVFLKDASPERHTLLRSMFKNLLMHTLVFSSFLISFLILKRLLHDVDEIKKFLAYLGLFALIWGAIVFVKSARFALALYLFLSHMKEAVPILLVNIFSLILSIGIGGWMATSVFGIQIAPLLATSAILSIVLGLALQDTLGNLFAGIALQFDKSYEIDDWLEIQQSGQKWIGKVNEITWRATMLTGFQDELVTIPNRIMAQTQVSNFSATQKPFMRVLLFKIPYGVSIEKAQEILIESALSIREVEKDPIPLAMISEATESWITLKLVYGIKDYGKQYVIADQVLLKTLERLKQAGIQIATQRLQIIQNPTVSSF